MESVSVKGLDLEDYPLKRPALPPRPQQAFSVEIVSEHPTSLTQSPFERSVFADYVQSTGFDPTIAEVERVWTQNSSREGISFEVFVTIYNTGSRPVNPQVINNVWTLISGTANKRLSLETCVYVLHLCKALQNGRQSSCFGFGEQPQSRTQALVCFLKHCLSVHGPVKAMDYLRPLLRQDFLSSVLGAADNEMLGALFLAYVENWRTLPEEVEGDQILRRLELFRVLINLLWDGSYVDEEEPVLHRLPAVFSWAIHRIKKSSRPLFLWMSLAVFPRWKRSAFSVMEAVLVDEGVSSDKTFEVLGADIAQYLVCQVKDNPVEKSYYFSPLHEVLTWGLPDKQQDSAVLAFLRRHRLPEEQLVYQVQSIEKEEEGDGNKEAILVEGEESEDDDEDPPDTLEGRHLSQGLSSVGGSATHGLVWAVCCRVYSMLFGVRRLGSGSV